MNLHTKLSLRKAMLASTDIWYVDDINTSKLLDELDAEILQELQYMGIYINENLPALMISDLIAILNDKDSKEYDIFVKIMENNQKKV